MVKSKNDKIQYLTIVKPIKVHNGTRNITYYECACVCGSVCITTPYDYNRKYKVSCGCLTKQLIKNRLIKEIPTDTVYGYLTVKYREEEHSTEGYKYLCLCSCGNYLSVYANRLKRGETKSCGCLSSKLNSLNNGGTGVPGELKSLQNHIRHSLEYKNWLVACMKRANYKSELSGLSGKYNVHHKDSLSYLIKQHTITKENYNNYMGILYDIDNGVVLVKEEHKVFHQQFGLLTTREMWDSFVLDQQKCLSYTDRPLTKKRELVVNEFCGKLVGNLTLLIETKDARGSRAYLCKCSCGNDKVYSLSTLKRNNWTFIKTCGLCTRIRKDLVNSTFGYLTVLNLNSITNKHKAIYDCICSCGNTKVISSEALLRGSTKSCGKCGIIKRGPRK